MVDVYPRIHAKMIAGPTTIGKMLVMRKGKEPKMLLVREYVVSYIDEEGHEHYKLRYVHKPRPIVI